MDRKPPLRSIDARPKQVVTARRSTLPPKRRGSTTGLRSGSWRLPPSVGRDSSWRLPKTHRTHQPGRQSELDEYDLVDVVRRHAFDAPTPVSDSISGRPVRRSATNVRFGSIAWRLFADQRQTSKHPRHDSQQRGHVGFANNSGVIPRYFRGI
jgi:hypothetical protein